ATAPWQPDRRIDDRAALASICRRNASSRAAASGRNTLVGNPDASYICRISHSPPPRTARKRGPRNRLILRVHLKNRVAGDQLLGLGEGAIDRGALPPSSSMRTSFALGCSPSAASSTP